MDEEATNFDPNATTDNGTCCYLDLEYDVVNALCNGGYGTINVQPVGIYPETEVEFTIDGEASEISSFDVMAGIYTITATVIQEGVLNCSVSIDVIVTAPDELTIDASASDASVLGNGTGVATVDGGTDPYNVVWTDSDGNAADSESLTEGEYVVSATDTNGCTVSTTVMVLWDFINVLQDVEFNLYPNPTDGIVYINSPTNVGDAVVLILDGVGREVYRSSVSNMTSLNTLDLNHLEAGSYSLAIFTENGKAVKSLQLVK
jgi:hypothetical protein